MLPKLVGDFKVSRVVDIPQVAFAADYLLPDTTPDTLARHRDWLEPDFARVDEGKLVLSFHGFVVHTGRQTILVDSCVGNHKERPGRPGWHRRDGPFLDELAMAGVHPEAVDVVLCTHLHADHIGWNTRQENGRWVPTFPNARYVFARRELDYWERVQADDPATPINHGAYHDSVLPVIEAGRALLVDDDHEIADGVWIEPAHGHTPGNVVLNLRSGERRAVVSGDVFHHPLQVAYPDWSSRFCDDPAQSAQTRGALAERMAEDASLLFPAHFAGPTAGQIVETPDGLRFVP